MTRVKQTALYVDLRGKKSLHVNSSVLICAAFRAGVDGLSKKVYRYIKYEIN